MTKEITLSEIDAMTDKKKLLDIWFEEMNIITSAEQENYSRYVNANRVTQARQRANLCRERLKDLGVYQIYILNKAN